MAEILHQLRLVVYPIIYEVLAPSQVVNRISAINSIIDLVLDPGWVMIFLKSWWKLEQWASRDKDGTCTPFTYVWASPMVFIVLCSTLGFLGITHEYPRDVVI